jgi:hypothetical protein
VCFQLRQQFWLYFHFFFDRINFCSADKHHDRTFAYIARSTENETMECHAFLCAKRKVVSLLLSAISLIKLSFYPSSRRMLLRWRWPKLSTWQKRIAKRRKRKKLKTGSGWVGFTGMIIVLLYHLANYLPARFWASGHGVLNQRRLNWSTNLSHYANTYWIFPHCSRLFTLLHAYAHWLRMWRTVNNSCIW